MPLEKLWRVFLCTQQLQAGDAGAHEETHWGGDWTGALRAGGGNAVSPRALLPVLLPLTPLPTVNLPYWGGCSWDPLLLAALLSSLTSGVWRLHPLCSVLESNQNTIINGGLVVLSFLFLRSTETRLPLSLSVRLTTAVPLFTDQSTTHTWLFVYWRSFSVAGIRGLCSAFLSKLQQIPIIVFQTGRRQYGMGSEMFLLLLCSCDVSCWATCLFIIQSKLTFCFWRGRVI